MNLRQSCQPDNPPHTSLADKHIPKVHPSQGLTARAEQTEPSSPPAQPERPDRPPAQEAAGRTERSREAPLTPQKGQPPLKELGLSPFSCFGRGRCSPATHLPVAEVTAGGPEGSTAGGWAVMAQREPAPPASGWATKPTVCPSRDLLRSHYLKPRPPTCRQRAERSPLP